MKEMYNKENIQLEIERTLQSLDGVKRAEANPFLFTRLQAKMQRQHGWERITSFISRPVIAIAVLVLVMAVNGWAVFTSDNDNTIPENEIVANNDIADTYNLVTTTNYDYENNPNE